MKKTKKLLYLLNLVILSSNLNSQITIGSSEKPITGALLDLKQEGITTKGLGLPKVQLTKLNPSNETELSSSIGGNGSWDLNEHIGLLIYNILDNPTCGTPKGTYIWNGELWTQISEPSINIETSVGNHALDVAALVEFYNTNPDNTLGWNINDLSTIETWTGTTWTTICGEKRLAALNVQNKNITQDTGLKKLIQLKELNISINKLTSLDVSNCINLSILYAYRNSLTSVNIPSSLTRLDSSNNKLTNIDLSKNSKLINLLLSNNQLENLNISNNPALTSLECYSNKLTYLDTSKNTELTSLVLTQNLLTSIDISKNLKLSTLTITNNPLTSIDISNNTLLKIVQLSNNQLTTLDISKNTLLDFLYIQYNYLDQTTIDKFKENPRFCIKYSSFVVTPQYLPSSSIVSTTTKPTCP